MAQDASSGQRPGPVRRLVAFLWQPDERPAVSRAARVADAAIAVVAVISAVVAVMMQYRNSGSYQVSAVPVGEPVVLHFQPGPGPSTGVLIGAALTTAPLAFRRTYPIIAFCVIMAGVFPGAHTTSITFAAVVLAAYSAAAYSRYRQAALFAVLAAAVIVTAAYPDTTPPVPKRFTALLILVPTVAVGVAIRLWRRRAGESAERLRVAEAGHEAQTRRAVALERARIASEMHDVVTHNVSVMVVQAGAARRVLDSSPGEARKALLAVEASGRTAMTELRYLLGLLAPSADDGADGTSDVSGTSAASGTGSAGGKGRASGKGSAGGTGDATLTPQPDVGQIGGLVDRVRAAGLPAELCVEGRRDLPPGLDLAAYRVVQEALTNVMKHAGQARTAIRIEYRAAELVITVCDDGDPAAAAPQAGSGRGLIGLRERIAVYGGELDAGRRPGGGWRLAARIPLEPETGGRAEPAEFQRAAT